MKRIWCEWDIGQEGLVFRNDDAAMRWIRNNHRLKQEAELEELDFETFLQGLYDVEEIGLIHLEVIE
jgi:hypothetical protein